MNAQKRRAEIARFIAANDGADIALLAERFGVSPMTIRRDRKVLADQNKIAPTHGGAVPVGFLYGELSYAQKVEANLEKKRAIARRAADLVRDDTCIFIDAGTTMLELAKLLMDRHLTVVTVDLHIALLLSQSPTIKVFTPGGEVDREVQSQLDACAVQFLKSINASLSFVGIAAWDHEKGATCGSMAKKIVKETILTQAEATYLLADSSKYGLCNPWDVAPLCAFSGIITDDGLSAQDARTVVQGGGSLTIVEN